MKTVYVRSATPDDLPFMWEMLAVAAHAEDEKPVMDIPELSRYLFGWGRGGDLGFLADGPSGESVGAVWMRLFPARDPGYGFVDEETPELAIGVRAGERGSGVGRALLEHLIAGSAGRYPAISLSVREDNPALHLYRQLGFEPVEGMEVSNRSGGRSLVLRLDLR